MANWTTKGIKKILRKLDLDPDYHSHSRSRWIYKILPAMATDICSGWFWMSRKLNKYADEDDVRAITLRINGGYNGLEDRKQYLERAKGVI